MAITAGKELFGNAEYFVVEDLFLFLWQLSIFVGVEGRRDIDWEAGILPAGGRAAWGSFAAVVGRSFLENMAMGRNHCGESSIECGKYFYRISMLVKLIG